MPFTSIIATLNPNAPRKLVIACHYESKIMEEGVFLAATDSAVPCAMMMNMAHILGRVFSNYVIVPNALRLPKRYGIIT